MSEKKKKLIIIALVLIVCVPIFYNKAMTYFIGQMRQKAMMAPPEVQITDVVEKDIFDSSESAGRLEAEYSVDVVARINGWLQKRYFKEGAFVKKGQMLFLIEPNEYQIAVQNAQAAVRQSQAALVNSEKELKRAAELVKSDYVSKSYYDTAVATRDQNRAMLDVNRSNLAKARLNLSYTRVLSPIDGKIGKIFITEGNLVNTQAGTLAQIVSVDPMYATFNLRSEEYLKFKKTNPHAELSNMQVEIQLADGSKYPIKGKVQFVDNVVDPSVGSIDLRATFPNPDRLLIPGDYIKVVASSTVPRKVVLVPQEAVQESTDGKYVMIIDSEGKAQQKIIQIEEEFEKKWIVSEGLKAGDKVIDKGLQKVRPGMKVKLIESKPDNASDGKETEKDNK